MFYSMNICPLGKQTNLFIKWIRLTAVYKNMRLLWKICRLLSSCFCTVISCSFLILAVCCLSFLQYQYHVWLHFPFSLDGSLSHLSVQMFNIGFLYLRENWKWWFMQGFNCSLSWHQASLSQSGPEWPWQQIQIPF